jgi:hypothetical protein
MSTTVVRKNISFPVFWCNTYSGKTTVLDTRGFVTESAGERVHAIFPKSLVASFNGAEVRLSFAVNFNMLRINDS